MSQDQAASTTSCTEAHAQFCSACTTARAYNSLHCQDCGEGRPSAATTEAAPVAPHLRNRLLAGNVSFQLDLPCPRCGEQTLMGFYFLTPDDGQHQHTHYVCLSWPRGRRVQCGWHDWVVSDA